MPHVKMKFLPLLGLCTFTVVFLISCSPSSVQTPQIITASPSPSPQSGILSTLSPTVEISTQIPIPSRTLTPSPASTPITQYRLPGNFFVIAQSEIQMVSVSCLQKWDDCTTTWLPLTNTPNPEQEFASEIFLDQISISPDGKRLVFSYRESLEFQGSFEGGWNIYVLDIEACLQLKNGCDSSMFVQLTEEPFDEISPAWAINGNEIAFITNRGPYEPFLNSYALYVMGADGSNQKPLISDETHEISGNISNPVWSSDGEKIVFNATSNQFRHPDIFIFIANRDGTNIQPLTSLPHEENVNKMDFRPQMSPDGVHILFESSRNPAGLYMMDSDGTNIMKLEINEDVSLPKWSPDGLMIAYLTSEGLKVMNREDGNTFLLLSNVHISNYLWSR